MSTILSCCSVPDHCSTDWWQKQMIFDKGVVGCLDVKLPEGNNFQNEGIEELKDNLKMKRDM